MRLMKTLSVTQRLVCVTPAQNQLTFMPKSIFYVVRQSCTECAHLSGECTTCPGATSASPLISAAPPKPPIWDHQHCLTMTHLLCLKQAQLRGTSQPSLRPPALPARRCQCPLLLPSRPSSLCQATWQALREVTSRRKCKQSQTHTLLLPVPSTYMGRIWLSSILLLFACICSVPGSLETTQPAEDRQGCLQHPQLFSYFPVGAGTFGVTKLCHGSCPRQLSSSSFV